MGRVKQMGDAYQQYAKAMHIMDEALEVLEKTEYAIMSPIQRDDIYRYLNEHFEALKQKIQTVREQTGDVELFARINQGKPVVVPG